MRRLPVGLMRSPMTPTWPMGMLTRRCELVTAKSRLTWRGVGVRPARRSFSPAMYSGVVPQQPPTTVTPASSMSRTASQYSCGLMS